MRVASVFVNIPVKSIAKAYSYSVPAELSFVEAGWRVFVPFGGRKVEGFVLAVQEQEALAIPLKDIQSVVDEEAWFSPQLIEICRWMADFYLCSLAETMRLFMPGKSGLKISVAYMANEEARDHMMLDVKLYGDIYRLLASGGPLGMPALRKALPEAGDLLEEAVGQLLRHRVLRKEYQAQTRMAARYERYVVLAGEVTEALRNQMKRRKAQLHLLDLLQEKGEQTVAALKEQKVSLPVIKALVEAGLVELRQRRLLRDSYREAAAECQEVRLTEDQQRTMDAIEPYIEERKHGGFLLYGVTGSGKTQVYIELARKVRAQGRQAIVLVPEIALTGQVVMAFKGYFSYDIVVMHSRLSLSERNDAILRVRQGEAGIIIGARSALFTPAEDVGLIILDEEQDMSYKQDESPRYHARVLAEKMAQVHGAALVLGSATPSLETYHRARNGELTLLSMPKRIGDLPLPEAVCVDMRRELQQGNRHILSRELKALIEQTMARGRQSIIMLNRRGYSTFVMCRSCGTVMKCRLCGLPLVYHKNGSLKCHHCDVQEAVPTVCPNCGSRYIKYFGSGTEKLEQELGAAVPSARVIRMDRDTTGAKFAHQEILTKFRKGEYDILLGTQMVAKGHDIPLVAAVGIISADASLNLPDFRAAERCFMLITQTAGRAGRHGEQGKVIVQSYNPEHYAVTCGIAQDYEGFYAQEIAMRKALFYPPFSRLVKIIFQHEAEETAKEQAEALVLSFRRKFAHDKKQEIIGPSPAVISCFRGVYRFVVLIKTAELPAVQEFLRAEGLHLRTDAAIDIDPIAMM